MLLAKIQVNLFSVMCLAQPKDWYLVLDIWVTTLLTTGGENIIPFPVDLFSIQLSEVLLDKIGMNW